MLAHCNLKQNMCLRSKQSSLFSFYALPSGGKLKEVVVHCNKNFSSSPGQVVKGGDSLSEGCEFESWCHILDGHFSN